MNEIPADDLTLHWDWKTTWGGAPERRGRFREAARTPQLLNQIPDAGDELTMLLGGEYVGQNRGQPFDFLLTRVLLQRAEEPLFDFRVVTQNLVHLEKITR